MESHSSVVSDLHRLDGILSQASECNFAILQTRPNHGYLADVSDNGSETDIQSQSSHIEWNLIFKPKLDRLKYAPIGKGDVVELSHIDENKNIFIRSTQHDNLFVSLLSKISESQPKQELSKFSKLNKNDVVLVKYDEDFLRAAVVDDDKLIVNLFDIGIEIESEAENIRYISSDVFAEPKMVTPVRLKLPEQLSDEENTAVVEFVRKWKHNRFKVVSTSEIVPHSVLDLIHIGNGQSLTEQCSNLIRKRYFIADIGQKQINCQTVDLCVVENENLANGIVTCVLFSEVQLFAERMGILTQFGQNELLPECAYVPEHLELCLVVIKDEDGAPLWYRGEYQQTLENGRAQVGLLDFGGAATVSASNVRAFRPEFAYDCLSILCKLQIYRQ